MTEQTNSKQPALAPVAPSNPHSVLGAQIALGIWFVLSMIAAGQIFGTVFSDFDGVDQNWFVGGMAIAAIANIPVIVLFTMLKKIHLNIAALRDAKAPAES
ncbi:hypothetical protein [Demequina sp. NBRC 110052]|uniref:hypothetical protein n=1 Tax=Demequina sp. NBRC 110052 TaxID=1570341 RepID=UPI0009FC3081|nr:hypothetical protein [Demequina sp. NBRC 110052]